MKNLEKHFQVKSVTGYQLYTCLSRMLVLKTCIICNYAFKGLTVRLIYLAICRVPILKAITLCAKLATALISITSMELHIVHCSYLTNHEHGDIKIASTQTFKLYNLTSTLIDTAFTLCKV